LLEFELLLCFDFIFSTELFDVELESLLLEEED